MKVLILSFYYPPDLCAGSFRVGSLIQPLLETFPTGTEFVVVTTLPNRYSSFNVEAREIEINGNVSIYRVRIPAHASGMFDQSKAFMIYAIETLKIVNKEKFDLVFTTSSRLMTAALGSLVSSLKKIPLYLDIRDIFADTVREVLPAYTSKFAFFIFSIIEGWAVRKATKINLVSKGFEPYFKKRYPKGNYSFFSNGIDDEFFNISQPSQNIQNTELKRTVLYAGNIGDGQGLHLILPDLAQAFKDELNFRIIGDGGRRELLARKLQEKKCENVEILPPVSRDILIQEYIKADVLFLHLNDYEAFRKVLPSKIFEYSVFCKPIWAGVAGYSADFITKEVENVAIFSPCNSTEGAKVFKKLSFKKTSRKDFIEKYARKVIMNSMAEDIYSVVRRLSR